MRKISTIIRAMLLLTLFSVNTGAAGPDKSPGTLVENGEKKPAVSREVACDCCQKCMAAKKDVKPLEEGPPAKNGCGDCCKRCGKVVKPPDEKFPPEIMEKNLNP